MHVKTNAGFILYVNGLQANSYGLPTTGVTPSTMTVVNGTDQVDRMMSTLRTLFIKDAPIGLAVEIHASVETTSGQETFNCSIVLDNTDDNCRIDSEGNASGSHYTYSWDNYKNVFDGLTSTKWCFIPSTTNWVAWQFNNGRRELINKYAVSTANDVPARDPVHWKIYGSNDMETWILLDERIEVTWTSRLETQSFVMNNYESYNAYKFEFLERAGYDSWDMYQFSEWNLMLSNQSLIQPELSYSPNTYEYRMGIDNADIRPVHTLGYASWTIAPALPNGLILNTNTGAISGSPTIQQAQTIYTVTAIYL